MKAAAFFSGAAFLFNKNSRSVIIISYGEAEWSRCIMHEIIRKEKKWWAVAESNCGHEAFQASALPTELTAHG
jgi:hypothetical protein